MHPGPEPALLKMPHWSRMHSAMSLQRQCCQLRRGWRAWQAAKQAAAHLQQAGPADSYEIRKMYAYLRDQKKEFKMYQVKRDWLILQKNHVWKAVCQEAMCKAKKHHITMHCSDHASCILAPSNTPNLLLVASNHTFAPSH